MHIPTELYRFHPKTIEALSKADDIIESFLGHKDHIDVKDVMYKQHWGVWAVFRESIATALLEAEGFDIEGLVLTVEDPRAGETEGDAIARFDREGFDHEHWWNGP